MNQSDRIKYCKEYYNHPLRKEYECKKEKIIKNYLKKHKPLYIVFFRGMIFVWLILFAGSVLLSGMNINSMFVICSYISCASLVLGLVNLVLAIYTSTAYNPDLEKIEPLNTLKTEYAQKGLYEMTEYQLYMNECCDYDDVNEIFVCSATKQPLSYDEIKFCQRPGNCRYCRAFVTAYLGPEGPDYWSYQFKR